MSIRLLCFVILLMPGWLALLKYYIFDSLIIRNIEYGKGLRYRNVLDVYLPRPHNPIYGKKQTKYDNGVPVVVFVSGGAWIIGYKLWSALMGREFARRGYVVIVPDYRNFPQGNIVDMMEDLKEALRWTVCNSSMFGGDPKKIVLAGQSAGAHISLCTIIELYESYLKSQRNTNSASSSQFNSHSRLKSDTFNSHFPHVDTAAVMISSSLCLSSTPTSNCGESALDQTDIDQSLPSEHSTSCPPSPSQLPSSETETGGEGVWWDVDTPTIKGPGRVKSAEYKHLPSPTSELDRNSMDILWDTANENPEYTEPLSDGTKPKKQLSSPVDNLQEILTPFSPPQYVPIPSPAALPLEINLLGSTEYASDVINDTARHNLDESLHDLDITDISLFIGISGPYNMVKLLQHLHYRGLDASILHHVFNSKVSQYSPVQRISRLLQTTPAKEKKSMWEDDENIIKQTYNQFYSYLFNVRSTPSTDESFMNLDNGFDINLIILTSS